MFRYPCLPNLTYFPELSSTFLALILYFPWTWNFLVFIVACSFFSFFNWSLILFSFYVNRTADFPGLLVDVKAGKFGIGEILWSLFVGVSHSWDEMGSWSIRHVLVMQVLVNTLWTILSFLIQNATVMLFEIAKKWLGIMFWFAGKISVNAKPLMQFPTVAALIYAQQINDPTWYRLIARPGFDLTEVLVLLLEQAFMCPIKSLSRGYNAWVV